VTSDPLAALRAPARERPVLIFLAGPNGAGKTTFFDEYLAGLGLPYVNADRLASEMAAPQHAAGGGASLDRRAFEEAERLRSSFLEAGLSFCTETVFSDPAGAKLAFLDRAREAGFAVRLVFIGLADVAVSIARVQHRVARGGHDIPDGKLRARFPRTLRNLRLAAPRVERAFLFDNSDYDRPYRLVLGYASGGLVDRHPPLPAWTSGLPGL
jgi:predicted ABC-type ATPase